MVGREDLGSTCGHARPLVLPHSGQIVEVVEVGISIRAARRSLPAIMQVSRLRPEGSLSMQSKVVSKAKEKAPSRQ
jgi:hypothetical protein